MCKIVQKRAFQIFLDPIQKRAPARFVQLEAVYLEALLYLAFECLFSAILDLGACTYKYVPTYGVHCRWFNSGGLTERKLSRENENFYECT